MGMGTANLSDRAARTRSALIEAGIDLLSVRPVDAIAIDEFVSAAGVGKGSFFNHFVDKKQFADAIALQIRDHLDRQVTRYTARLPDPVERLAAGMIVAAGYTLTLPKKTIVLSRSLSGMSLDTHPVNINIMRDIREAQRAGAVAIPSDEAAMIYWLGACRSVMSNMIESDADLEAAVALLSDMLVMSLRGLGVESACANELSRRASVHSILLRIMELIEPV